MFEVFVVIIVNCSSGFWREGVVDAFALVRIVERRSNLRFM